jgi:hypothetical protein
MILELTITTHVGNAKLLITINNSIFRNFSKIQNGFTFKFCKLYFLVTLKCKRDHIYALTPKIPSVFLPISTIFDLVGGIHFSTKKSIRT